MNAVIDVNVLIAANLRNTHASLDCAENCIKFLDVLQKETGSISVDLGGDIFQEYSRYCQHSGEPGVGDAFFKWLHDNQGYDNICEMVIITPNDSKVYEEFPDDAQLSKFDLSDRKYVAVAIVSNRKPAIYNATDSDWKIFQSAFRELGIDVYQHCP